MKHKENLKPGLYVVATPIGNLGDISQRALQILEQVQWIAAEDTRQSKKLLSAFGIQTPLFSYHAHSSDSKAEKILERLEAGETGALVSDAGSPGICDPGAELVAQARERGIQVFPIPGASTPITFLMGAGFSTVGFSFQGFFPRENSDRKNILEKIKREGGLHVFFESPQRIQSALEDLAKFFPQEKMVLARELTKIYETFYRGTVSEVRALLSEEESRGEFVFGLELPAPDAQAVATEKVTALLNELHQLGANQKVLTAVAQGYGYSRNEAYSLALNIQKS